MKDTIKGARFVRQFDSVDELASYVDNTGPYSRARPCSRTEPLSFFGDVSPVDALNMARNGWSDQLQDALTISESAVLMADKEQMVDTFQPVWDVTGAEVDVAAFLADTPECMIDYPVSKISREGRTITLVASLALSAAISSDTFIRRGQVITALAMALQHLGHAVEIYVNVHVATPRKVPPAEISVKVKGTDDVLDPAAIMFALAHPAMLRCLLLTVAVTLPGEWGSKRRDRRICGMPVKPTADLYPEGSIILPEICSDKDVPEADQFLRDHLGELGLLAE